MLKCEVIFARALSLAMQWLNVGYAAYYNKKRQRSGHLFQGRFKSVLIEADEYLKPISRYIHLNSVQAGMVNNQDEFFWSNYPSFIGKIKTPDWLETGFLLNIFGKKKEDARKTKPGRLQSVLQETLAAQRTANWVIFLVAYLVWPLPWDIIKSQERWPRIKD